MNLWVRSWTAAGVAVLALTSIPEIYAVVQPSGVANADVCASVGRRVSVSGCRNVPIRSTPMSRRRPTMRRCRRTFRPHRHHPPPVNVCVGGAANPCKRVLIKARLRALASGDA